MTVAALVPAYNEAATIADVVRGVQPFASQVLSLTTGRVTGPQTGHEVPERVSSLMPPTWAKEMRCAQVDGPLASDITHVICSTGYAAPSARSAAAARGCAYTGADGDWTAAFDPAACRPPLSCERIGSRRCQLRGGAVEDTRAAFGCSGRDLRKSASPRVLRYRDRNAD